MNPSVYAVLELERGEFYTGVVATPSSIAGEIRPFVLLYAGRETSIHGFDAEIGARYYTFPGSSDFEFDLDADGVVDHSGKKGFVEIYVGAGREIRSVKLKARAFYSPDIFGETGGSLYINTSLKAPIGRGFDIRADVGVSEFARNKFNDDYVNYGVGVYKTAFGLDFFLRYSDTHGLAGSDDRVVVFGIEKAWSLLDGVSERNQRRRKIRNRDWRVEKTLLGIPNYGRSGD